MRTFADKKGREWSIEITIGSIKRVRDLLGLNLAQPYDGSPPLQARLASDIIAFCDALYALVKPQADEAGIDDAKFAELIHGDAILKASDAFWEEWRDFFQSAGRTDAAKAISKQRQMTRLAVETAEKRVEQIDAAQKVESIFSSLDTNTPESSA
jgi:hypothetical protein